MTTAEMLPLVPKTSPDLYEAGTVVDQYELHEQIASRDNSEVYRGINLATQQLVAVKFAKDYDPDSKSLHPFALEVAVHKKISSDPNIVTLDGHNAYSALEGNARPYIATQLQAGTFADRLKRGDDATQTLTASPVLLETKDQLAAMVKDTEKSDTGSGTLFLSVAGAVDQSHLAEQIAKDADHITPQDVVEKVVMIAKENDQSVTPDDLTVQKIALETVETAAQIEVAEAKSHVSHELTESEILDNLRILKGVANGYVVSHKAGYVQRDGKPSNYFYDIDDEGQLHGVLSDFGIAVKDGYRSKEALGSPGYTAPEEFVGVITESSQKSDPSCPETPSREERSIRYTKAGDMYKFYTVLFEAVTGEKPYILRPEMSDSDKAEVLKGQPTHIDKLNEAPVSGTIKTLILRGLSRHMALRPSAEYAARTLANY